MSVGQRELTHSRKAVHFAAALITEQSRGFGIAAGQVAIAFNAVFIYEILERTGHGTKRHDFVVHSLVAEHEHTFFIMIPMSGNLIEIALGHKRGFCQHIAAALFFVLDKALQRLQNFGAFRHEKRKSLAYKLVGHENAELTPYLVVIALFCLLEFFEILGHFRFFLESRAVYSGKHLVIFVSLPVRAGYLSELETFNFSRTCKMRSGAKIDEISLRIQRYLRAARQLFYKLKLIYFVEAAHLRNCLFAGHHRTDDGKIGFDYGFHFLFDARKIIHSNRRRQIEIVVESVLDGRTDSQFCLRVKIFHRLRENVRAGMSVGLSSLFVLKGQNFKTAVFLDRKRKINEAAVETRDKRGSRQPLTDPCRNSGDLRTVFGLNYRAVLQCDFNHDISPFSSLFP